MLSSPYPCIIIKAQESNLVRCWWKLREGAWNEKKKKTSFSKRKSFLFDRRPYCGWFLVFTLTLFSPPPDRNPLSCEATNSGLVIRWTVWFWTWFLKQADGLGGSKVWGSRLTNLVSGVLILRIPEQMVLGTWDAILRGNASSCNDSHTSTETAESLLDLFSASERRLTFSQTPADSTEDVLGL